MSKDRLTAFTDGVVAVIITIMVLELKEPAGESFRSLLPLWPTFLAYVLSFTYVAIYWNSHHHLLYATKRVDGRVLWANLVLLFWLSLIPLTTGWIGAAGFAVAPTALYGIVLLACGFSYVVLQSAIIARNADDDTLARALGRDWKGKTSLALYALAVAVAFVLPPVSDLIYGGVAVMWFVPDRRIERAVAGRSEDVEKRDE